MSDIVFLPVGIQQESPHLDVDGQLIPVGRWHYTAYPFTAMLCQSDWALPPTYRMSKTTCAILVADCAICNGYSYKLVVDGGGAPTIPIDLSAARRRAQLAGYSLDMPMGERRII